MTHNAHERATVGYQLRVYCYLLYVIDSLQCDGSTEYKKVVMDSEAG